MNLLVVLRPAPVLALVDDCPPAGFRLAEATYSTKDYGDWTGFYDWLRDLSGAVLGVRYSPFEDTEFLIDQLSSLSYVATNKDNGYVDIYFSDRRGVDEEHSDDQGMITSKVFASETGEWAICFHTGDLNASELEDVRRHAAGADVVIPRLLG